MRNQDYHKKLCNFLNKLFIFSISLLDVIHLEAQTKIIKAEYYIDTDPGFGKAIAIPFPTGTDIPNLIFNPDITTVEAGLHQLHIRAMDADDSWSLNNTFSFSKINVNHVGTLAPAANIIKAEYYIDKDPGLGNAINIPFSPGTDLSNLVFNPDITRVQAGLHQLRIQGDGRR